MHIKNLVSVGIPTYNEESHIEELLLSIAKDSYLNKEIIISDNNSTDLTFDIIKKFQIEFKNKYNIHITKQSKNRGAVYNFNYVLEHSNGEFFIWAGAHDKWGANMIRECVRGLQNNQSAALAVPLIKWIDSNSEILDKKHNIIDTRPHQSPAKRVTKLVENFERCTAIYGLHRKNVLIKTLPWPQILGNDNFGLARIAKLAHIIPIKTTSFYRRITPDENNELEKQRRRVTSMGLTGLKGKMPRTLFQVIFSWEHIFTKGNFVDRIQLIRELFFKFLGINLLKTILLELSPRIHNKLRSFILSTTRIKSF